MSVLLYVLMLLGRQVSINRQTRWVGPYHTIQDIIQHMQYI